MVLLLLTVTTWSPQMLFGECDRALREASPQMGATRPSPRQRPRLGWAQGQAIARDALATLTRTLDDQRCP